MPPFDGGLGVSSRFKLTPFQERKGVGGWFGMFIKQSRALLLTFSTGAPILKSNRSLTSWWEAFHGSPLEASLFGIGVPEWRNGSATDL